jgi:hypothetical protein
MSPKEAAFLFSYPLLSGPFISFDCSDYGWYLLAASFSPCFSDCRWGDAISLTGRFYAKIKGK